MSPTVSVIIPNYNYEKTLGLCLSAVYDQTHRPAEVIVVDDGSTDDSLTIAARFPCTVLTSGSNRGVAAARNLGAARATGDVLFFLDSDVVLRDDAIAQAVRLLEEDPSLGSVCGIYTPAPLIRDSLVEEYRSLQAHYWRKSSVGLVNVGFFSLGAVRRTVFEEIGPFNERLWQTEEVDYGQRLSRRYGLLLTDKVVGRHDDDDALWPLMRKLARRARLRVPLYLRRRRFMTGFETRERALGVLAAGVSAAALLASPAAPSPVVPGAVALAGLAAFAASDRHMYRFVRRERGRAFLAYFLAVHYLVALSIASGVAAGLFRYAVSAEFRGLYDTAPVTVGGAGER
ncbi:glycosyltransferase family 2 protein [Actinomadura kijaniata]|uniref:glycosyltransferase family 2 protein n=1 Tax=Actinomadura kijaniata TaxID=46161 RepID=UPI00082959C5|nr:glycosyltransferase family A protein [Actinomadura kijaniata]